MSLLAHPDKYQKLREGIGGVCGKNAEQGASWRSKNTKKLNRGGRNTRVRDKYISRGFLGAKCNLAKIQLHIHSLSKTRNIPINLEKIRCTPEYPKEATITIQCLD